LTVVNGRMYSAVVIKIIVVVVVVVGGRGGGGGGDGVMCVSVYVPDQ